MAVVKFTEEIKVRVPAKRMFKAMVTETFDLLPKVMPHVVKNIEILQGNGGVGTIRQTNFAEGIPFPHMKHRMEHLDVDNCVTKYSLIEGDVLGDKLESIYYDQKYEDTPDGGCYIKVVRECRGKDGVELKEDDLKEGEENALDVYKLVEEYLLAHPEVCA